MRNKMQNVECRIQKEGQIAVASPRLVSAFCILNSEFYLG